MDLTEMIIVITMATVGVVTETEGLDFFLFCYNILTMSCFRGWSIEYEGRPPRRGGDSERGGDQGDRRGDRYDRYLRTSSPAGHHPGNRDEYWDYRGSSSGGGGYDRRQYTER